MINFRHLSNEQLVNEFTESAADVGFEMHYTRFLPSRSGIHQIERHVRSGFPGERYRSLKHEILRRLNGVG
jgi:hypothetical protein